MKKAILASLLASVVLLSGCSGVGSALEQAEEFYAAGNYQNVIWTLNEYRGNEEADAMILSANVQMALAEAKEAMNEGDYEKAVSVLSWYSNQPEVAATYEEANAIVISAKVQEALSDAKEAMNDGYYGSAVSILEPYSERPEVAATYEEAKKAAEEKNAIQSAESVLDNALADRNIPIRGSGAEE